MIGPGQKTIEGMSHADLAKFVHNILATQNPDKAASYDQMDVHSVLNIKDKLNISPQAKAALFSGYAPLASPVLLGDPQAPTPAVNDADTSIATTAFVDAVKQAALSVPALRLEGGGTLLGGTTSGSRITNHDSTPIAVATLTNFVAQKYRYDATIDGPPTGYKTQWLMEVVWRTNATAPAANFEFGPWQMTAFGGAAGGYTTTAAGTVSSPNVTITAPAAASSGSADSGWVDHGSAGAIASGSTYFFDLFVSATMAANSAFEGTYRLYRRFVPLP